VTNLLDLAKDANHVFSQHFLDVASAVASFQERFGNFWQISGRVHAFRKKVLPVKIGTETNVINAGNFHYMINVVNQRLQRGSWDFIFTQPLKIEPLRVLWCHRLAGSLSFRIVVLGGK